MGNPFSAVSRKLGLSKTTIRIHRVVSIRLIPFVDLKGWNLAGEKKIRKAFESQSVLYFQASITHLKHWDAFSFHCKKQKPKGSIISVPILSGYSHTEHKEETVRRSSICNLSSVSFELN